MSCTLSQDNLNHAVHQLVKFDAHVNLTSLSILKLMAQQGSVLVLICKLLS